MSEISLLHSENEVDHHGRQQRQGQNGRPKAIVNACLSSFSDALRPPMESDQGIDHGRHCNEGKQGSRNATDSVTKVQKSNRQSTQNNREIQPGEKGTLIREEDLGLYTGWESNSFAWFQKC